MSPNEVSLNLLDKTGDFSDQRLRKVLSQIGIFLSLPVQMAAEIAAPLSHAKKLTMVSAGPNEVGVNKITTEVLQVVERLPKMVEGITGVDIAKVMSVYCVLCCALCCLVLFCA